MESSTTNQTKSQYIYTIPTSCGLLPSIYVHCKNLLHAHLPINDCNTLPHSTVS